MRDFLQARLQKNRAPPLVHSWDFWYDHQANSSLSDGNEAVHAYESRLKILTNIDNVAQFWNTWNNFDITRLQLRDSVHLFHKGVKPVWEDPRNFTGGSWTFRVPKAQAVDFWKEVCMMAIGEQLQAAVESERTTFRDDVCGISISARFNSMLVQVWNRDSQHEEGIQKLLSTVVENLQDAVRPRDGSYFYKKHSEHAAFKGSLSSEASSTSTLSPVSANEGPGEMQCLNAVLGGGA